MNKKTKLIMAIIAFLLLGCVASMILFMSRRKEVLATVHNSSDASIVLLVLESSSIKFECDEVLFPGETRTMRVPLQIVKEDWAAVVHLNSGLILKRDLGSLAQADAKITKVDIFIDGYLNINMRSYHKSKFKVDLPWPLTIDFE